MSTSLQHSSLQVRHAQQLKQVVTAGIVSDEVVPKAEICSVEVALCSDRLSDRPIADVKVPAHVEHIETGFCVLHHHKALVQRLTGRLGWVSA